MSQTVTPYTISNKILSEIMFFAIAWGEKHGISNMAVVGQAMRLAADQLEKIASKHGKWALGTTVRIGQDDTAENDNG